MIYDTLVDACIRWRDLEVVLIDADMANPSIKEVFGLPEHTGLMDVLADSEIRVENHVLKTDIDGLWLLPPGRNASLAPPSAL